MNRRSYEACASDRPLLGETIGQCLDRVAATYPDNELLVSVPQGLRFTYREFVRIVNHTAKAFLKLGIRRGDRVAIWSINNYEWVVAQLATARIGAVLVNVNPAYRTHELEYVLKESRARALLLIDSFKSSNYLDMFYEICPDALKSEPGHLESWRFPHLRSVIFIGEEQHPGMFTRRSFANLGGEMGDGILNQLHPNARAAATEVAVFLCPSDGATGTNVVVMGSANPASDNYAANAGWPTSATGIAGQNIPPMKYNGIVTLQNPSRSEQPTLAHSPVRVRNVSDGLSKTAAIAERLIQTAVERSAILEGDERLMSFHITTGGRSLPQMAERCDSTNTHADAQHSAYLGRAWISGWSPTGATYRHLKPPNTTNCHFGDSFTSGEFIVTPSSYHTGGVNVAMADGHVRFVADDVQPTVWWSMGNRQEGTETQ